MKVLIAGASGLLGVNAALVAMKHHVVVGVARRKLAQAPFQVSQLDLLAAGSVDRALEVLRPDAVINCAALADVDRCEKDPVLARQLNAEMPGRLAAACDRLGIALVHVSTDAVFDGVSEDAYAETDLPHPLGVYAETKLEGERLVLSQDPQAVVARVNFFGWSIGGTRSLAEFFVNNLRVGNHVHGFTDVTFCPMLVTDLATILLEMLTEKLQGLFHAVGPEAMTKHDFAVRIAREFGLSERLIAPMLVNQAGLGAPRAHNLHLSVHKLSTALGRPLPGFSRGLDRFLTQYQQGYPQFLHSLTEPELKRGNKYRKATPVSHSEG